MPMTDRAQVLAKLATTLAALDPSRPLTWRICESARVILGCDGAAITFDYTSRSRITVATTDDISERLAFADLATVLIIHSDEITAEMAIDRARDALASRTVVEQAKGVLSHQHGFDMAAAYAHLKKVAAETGASLTAAADAVLLGAQQR